MSPARMDETTAMCCFAREKATFRRFSPPLWLIGPKFIRILPVGPATVADAQDDHVPLVALDVLEVLHEQADELAVVLALVLRLQRVAELLVVLASRSQRRLDLALLGLGEGDDRRCGRSAARAGPDELGDVVGLGRVPAAARRRAVLEEVEADRPVQERVDVAAVLPPATGDGSRPASRRCAARSGTVSSPPS